MHSTGYFIDDKRPFSEKNWAYRTEIYIKLIKELSDSWWDGFYAGLACTAGIEEKLDECSRPAWTWTNDPNEHFIVGSDSVEEEFNPVEEELNPIKEESDPIEGEPDPVEEESDFVKEE